MEGVGVGAWIGDKWVAVIPNVSKGVIGADTEEIPVTGLELEFELANEVDSLGEKGGRVAVGIE